MLNATFEGERVHGQQHPARDVRNYAATLNSIATRSAATFGHSEDVIV
jgi:hypothetical protein